MTRQVQRDLTILHQKCPQSMEPSRRLLLLQHHCRVVGKMREGHWFLCRRYLSFHSLGVFTLVPSVSQWQMIRIQHPWGLVLGRVLVTVAELCVSEWQVVLSPVLPRECSFCFQFIIQHKVIGAAPTCVLIFSKLLWTLVGLFPPVLFFFLLSEFAQGLIWKNNTYFFFLGCACSCQLWHRAI